ncbi:MAG: hypothetical protein V7K25_30910 [Nostoc sp.]|uniref:hypothetical protein n=1 Tax=Nostoc sp. TaxID=1180 RepID=UPI002FFCB6BF
MVEFHIFKKKYTIGGLVASFVLLTTPMAFASVNTGTIKQLRLDNVSTGTPRVSIQLIPNQNTSCSAQGVYAYNNAVTGIGSLLTQGLLAAYQSGQQVTITGTGTCDQFGIEKVQYIDILQQ